MSELQNESRKEASHFETKKQCMLWDQVFFGCPMNDLHDVE